MTCSLVKAAYRERSTGVSHTKNLGAGAARVKAGRLWAQNPSWTLWVESLLCHRGVR